MKFSESDKEQVFSRRAFILGTAQALLLSTIVGRMYYLEILSNHHYKALSDKNRIHSRFIAPLRGQILDRNGKLLATNHNVYRAVIIRDQAIDWQQSLKAVQPFLNLSEEDLRSITKEIKSKPKFVPITLKDNISWIELTKIELHLSDLSGIMIEEGRNRFYPYPLETSHFIGYVATPSTADLNGDPLLELPGYKIGKNGLEKSLENSLRGIPGVKQVEVNATGKVVRELATEAGTAGETLSLSIDLSLQQLAYQRLQDHHSGSAVLLDIHTGETLVYASVPGFDNNLFVHGIPQTDWDHLLHHPYKALINKPLTGQYSPGSTFKMVVGLAALESKVVTPQTVVHCTGHVLLGNHKFHCWRSKGGHGPVNMEMALARSCDTYFFHIAGLLGIDAISTMAQRLGLGEKTGIEILGEKKGLIPTRNWKQVMFGRKWSLGETYNASIGQGYVLTTPLQLAVMAARLASGKKVTPTLLRRPVQPFAPLEVNPKFIQLMQEGMNQVVNTPGSTAYQCRIDVPGMEMAGKTGTTQVRRITEKERASGQTSSANWLWHHRDHALFVAFAPVTDPRYALAVCVEHGVSGAKVAGPIARDILLAAQQRT